MKLRHKDSKNIGKRRKPSSEVSPSGNNQTDNKAEK